MGQGAIDYIGVKGGLDIRGLITDYYVYTGSKVSAGDFVEFINGVASRTTETSVDTAINTTSYYGAYISACKLTNNKVFIAHSSGFNVAENHLYGIVCIIEGASITYGTDTLICSNDYSGRYFSIDTLSETSVFISCRGTSTTLSAFVCTITGTTISVGTSKQLSSVTDSYRAISVRVLTANKVLVAHSYNTYKYLYGMICTISGTNITAGTDTQLSTAKYTGVTISTAFLESTKVFIAHSRGSSSSSYLTGVVCTISGTTITAGTSNELSSATNSGKVISVVALSSTKVFIAYSSDSGVIIHSIVCTISGATITAGTEVELYNTSVSIGDAISALYLGNNKVVVGYNYGATSSTRNLYTRICTISGTTITKSSKTKSNSAKQTAYAISALLLGSNVFIAHSYDGSWCLYAQLYGVDETDNVLTDQVTTATYETQVRTAMSSPCKGVAETDGEGGDNTGHKDIVSIFQPKSAFNLIKNGNFIDGLEGWTTDTTYYSVSLATLENKKCVELKLTNPTTAGTTVSTYVLQPTTTELTKSGHTYYISCLYYGDTSNPEYSSSGNGMGPAFSHRNATGTFQGMGSLAGQAHNIEKWQKYNRTTTVSFSDGQIRFSLYAQNANQVLTAGMKMYFTDFKVYDLTEMFGAGNEPTRKWCDENL